MYVAVSCFPSWDLRGVEMLRRRVSDRKNGWYRCCRRNGMLFRMCSEVFWVNFLFSQRGL